MTHIGVITALESEAGCLDRFLNHADLQNFVSGPGASAAALAASRAIEARCNTLVSYGYAGALDPALRAGDLLIGLSISNEKNKIESDNSSVQQLISKIDKTNGVRAQLSTLYAAPSIVTSAAQKAKLRRRGGWDAVDMESFAVGCAALQHGLSFLIVRAIVDTAELSLPDNLSKMIDERGAILRKTALWGILKNPLDLPKYSSLAGARKKADQALRRVAPLLVKVLIDSR